MLLLLVLLLSLGLPARASYLLVADFIKYKNSLHSFVDISAWPDTAQCCDGREPGNCTDPCDTILNYCFKEAGSVDQFTDDDTVLLDCIGETRNLNELRTPMDCIDFSDPPFTVSGAATWSSISNRRSVWTGGMQFFIRSTANGNIVDYLSTDIYLNPGETLKNQVLTGDFFGGNLTFLVNFSLICTFDSFGDNCSIYCDLDKERFDGTGCVECPNEGCEPDLDVCGSEEPCAEGNCTNTGAGSYECRCREGYSGVNCTDGINTNVTTDDDLAPGVSTTFTLVTVSGVAGVLAPLIILFPLLLILCFTAIGAWRSTKKNDYVQNPLYTPVPPSSASNTMASERGHSSAAAELPVIIESGDETPSPCNRPLDDTNYAIIPGEELDHNEMGSQVAPGSTVTFRTDDNSSHNLSNNEMGSPYYNSYAGYDVPPPALPKRNLTLSIPSSYRSNDDRDSLEVSMFSADDLPFDHDPYLYCDIVKDGSGALSIQLPLHIALPRNCSVRRSKSSRSRVRYPRLHHHHQQQQHQQQQQQNHHAHSLSNSLMREPLHKPLTKSSSAGMPAGPPHYNHSLDRMHFAHYTNEHDLPPVPPHGLNSQFSIFSGDSDKRSATLGSESSAKFPNLSQLTLTADSHHNSQTTVVGEDSKHFQLPSENKSTGSHVGQKMGNTEGHSAVEHPPEIAVIHDSDYDKVAEDVKEDTYNHLPALGRNKNPYAPYDVPRKDTTI